MGFASQNPDFMHACGHAAMLLGAAKGLYEHCDELAATGKVLFQPDE